MSTFNSIHCKVLAITGGSDGQGEATVRHLAKLGARLVQ
ncbi:hypothetical protein Q058_00136 [Pseudomonas aeruginosa BL04]|nr:hypothetical protein Q058_00136 [Pseudomonas aeruginosa BL04]